jgi:hypothetical protein
MKVHPSMVEVDKWAINKLLRNCDLADFRLRLIRKDLSSISRPSGQPIPPIPGPADSKSFQERWNRPYWKEDIIERMKSPIKWDTLVSLLKEFGFSDYEIGLKKSSHMIISLSKEARARHGNYESGRINNGSGEEIQTSAEKIEWSKGVDRNDNANMGSMLDTSNWEGSKRS